MINNSVNNTMSKLDKNGESLTKMDLKKEKEITICHFPVIFYKRNRDF